MEQTLAPILSESIEIWHQLYKSNPEILTQCNRFHKKNEKKGILSLDDADGGQFGYRVKYV